MLLISYKNTPRRDLNLITPTLLLWFWWKQRGWWFLAPHSGNNTHPCAWRGHNISRSGFQNLTNTMSEKSSGSTLMKAWGMEQRDIWMFSFFIIILFSISSAAIQSHCDFVTHIRTHVDAFPHLNYHCPFHSTFRNFRSSSGYLTRQWARLS